MGSEDDQAREVARIQAEQGMQRNREVDQQSAAERAQQDKLFRPDTEVPGSGLKPPNYGRPGFFSRPVLMVGGRVLVSRWVFLALPIAVALFVGLRNNDQLLPLWIRAVTAGAVLLVALPLFRRVLSRLIPVAVVIVIIGLVLHWWSFTVFGLHL